MSSIFRFGVFFVAYLLACISMLRILEKFYYSRYALVANFEVDSAKPEGS